ncbi:phosphatidate cytidylyltransferase [Paratractidigestivibacter sp.]|uniref:phosphatidate cytidylyltransferase n=1 Tax=Paratractidigestivibacter sp. TaxID=2847316 RepID=UPI003AB331F9
MDKEKNGVAETERVSVGLDRQVDKLEARRAAKEGQRAAGKLAGQRARGATEKLLTRTTSGAIYALLIVACLFIGPFTTTLLVVCMAWLCCSEFFRMTRMGGRMPNEIYGLTAAILFPLAAYFRGVAGLAVVLLLFLVAIAAWYVATPRAGIGDVAVSVFGPIYTSFAFSAIVLVRVSDKGVHGALLTLGVMLSLWANDAVAYLVGSRIGSHKLAPRISPNKSWEGFWAGLVGSVAVWVVLALAGVANIGVPLAAVVGLVVGIVGVVGDLFESRIKRGVGVKDSGNLIPGHGGLLDRSDSLLFGSIAAYILLLFGGIL